MEEAEATAFPTLASQDCSKRSIISKLGEVNTYIFGGDSSGGYDRAIIDKIKKNIHILQENQNQQS